MRITSFLVAALATVVSAATQSASTTHRPTLGAGFKWASKIPDYQSTAASVAGITSGLTTYEISCLTNAPKSVCNIETPWTLVQGSTTFSFTGKYTASTSASVGTVTVDREFECSFTSTSSGTSYSTSTSTSTSSLPTESMKYSSLLITGGIAKITSAQSTSTTGAANPTAKAMITGAPMGAAAAVAIAAML
ncbi:unnamed protein product [Penicillium bialowiezense]